MMEAEAEGEGEAPPPVAQPVDPAMQTPELNEFKTIDNVHLPKQPSETPTAPAENPEAYFNDAPEGRVKKPFY
jgi:hypothetical protein